MVAPVSAVPKPTFKKKARKRLARIGKVQIRYEHGTRQPFLAALWSAGDPTLDERARTVLSGATLTSRCLPKYFGTGTVLIERRAPEKAPREFLAGAKARRCWWWTDGHVHHEVGGRNRGRREDGFNLVLLSTAAHEKVHR